MNHEVQVFEIAPDAKPADRPRAVQGFAVSGDTLEDARRAALERLRADGRAVRSLSFVESGGLAAVVLPPAPPPKPIPAPRARRARGGR
jgi:hypothetical protein